MLLAEHSDKSLSQEQICIKMEPFYENLWENSYVKSNTLFSFICGSFWTKAFAWIHTYIHIYIYIYIYHSIYTVTYTYIHQAFYIPHPAQTWNYSQAFFCFSESCLSRLRFCQCTLFMSLFASGSTIIPHHMCMCYLKHVGSDRLTSHMYALCGFMPV